MNCTNYEARERCELLAEYLIKNESTVREAATHFGVSKSTVHKDVTERLKVRNTALYELVRCLLDKNKSLRHLRGGEATKNKYLLTKQGSENLSFTK